jgi:hypothetical protein
MEWLNNTGVEVGSRATCTGLTCGIHSCPTKKCPNNGGCAAQWCWTKSCYIKF